MTQTQGKVEQVFNDLWQSLGGSGTNPDIAQFKSKLSSASPEQMIQAGTHFEKLIQPLIQEGDSAPRTAVEAVALFSNDLVRRYKSVATEAMTR